jgi:hypothetical protein
VLKSLTLPHSPVATGFATRRPAGCVGNCGNSGRCRRQGSAARTRGGAECRYYRHGFFRARVTEPISTLWNRKEILRDNSTNNIYGGQTREQSDECLVTLSDTLLGYRRTALPPLVRIYAYNRNRCHQVSLGQFVNVRFSLNSGHSSPPSRCPLWAKSRHAPYRYSRDQWI